MTIKGDEIEGEERRKRGEGKIEIEINRDSNHRSFSCTKPIQRLPLFGVYFFNINSGARSKYN